MRETEQASHERKHRDIRSMQTKLNELNAKEVHADKAAETSGKSGEIRKGGGPTGNVSLNMFLTVELENLNSVGEKADWEEVKFTVDSGASETVVGEEMLGGVPMQASAASRRGVHYETGDLAALEELQRQGRGCARGEEPCRRRST